MGTAICSGASLLFLDITIQIINSLAVDGDVGSQLVPRGCSATTPRRCLRLGAERRRGQGSTVGRGSRRARWFARAGFLQAVEGSREERSWNTRLPGDEPPGRSRSGVRVRARPVSEPVLWGTDSIPEYGVASVTFLSETETIAPSAKSTLSGSSPGDVRHSRRASNPSTTVPAAGDAPKIQTGNVAPCERNWLAVDGHAHALTVALLDLSIELIAHDQSDFVLGDVELETVRRFGKTDQLQIVEVPCEGVWGRRLPRDPSWPDEWSPTGRPGPYHGPAPCHRRQPRFDWGRI